jgi:hypothetical protein
MEYNEIAAKRRKKPSAAEPQPNRGWKRPESSQGNGCQGNKPEDALSHSLDNDSPDFGFFAQNGGLRIFSRMPDFA